MMANSEDDGIGFEEKVDATIKELYQDINGHTKGNG